MGKKYQLSIPEPCKEDWNAMPLNGKGRDCAKCERNIRDFTKMSDNELIGILTSEKNVCGRFTAQQLDRPLLKENRGLIPTFNLYAVAAGLGTLMTFPSLAADFGCEKSPVNLIEQLHTNESLPTQFNDAMKDSLTHFYVFDNYQYNRIVGAEIRLFNDQKELVDVIKTDEDGYASYSFESLERNRIHEIKISVSEKFEAQTITWTPDGDQQLIITLNSTEAQEHEPQIFLGYVVRP
ncbi:MAG: carboxypeptidase-like regulatory domain-containing protein [Fluviicola sp.]